MDVVQISPAARKALHTPDASRIASQSPADRRDDSHAPDEAQTTVVLTPVINDLLEHQPGDVPFSTHLELENDRARLLADARFRAGLVAMGIAGLHPETDAVGDRNQDRPDSDQGSDAADILAALAARTRCAPCALRKTEPDRRALAKQAALAQPSKVNAGLVPMHERLPIGGLLDLVM